MGELVLVLGDLDAYARVGFLSFEADGVVEHVGRAPCVVDVGERSLAPRHHTRSRSECSLAERASVAHHQHRVGVEAHEGHTLRLQRAREPRVVPTIAVARVHRVGLRLLRCGDERADLQATFELLDVERLIARLGVDGGFRMDAERGDTEAAASAGDPGGGFTASSDEDSGEHGASIAARPGASRAIEEWWSSTSEAPD